MIVPSKPAPEEPDDQPEEVIEDEDMPAIADPYLKALAHKMLRVIRDLRKAGAEGDERKALELVDEAKRTAREIRFVMGHPGMIDRKIPLYFVNIFKKAADAMPPCGDYRIETERTFMRQRIDQIMKYITAIAIGLHSTRIVIERIMQWV